MKKIARRLTFKGKTIRMNRSKVTKRFYLLGTTQKIVEKPN